MSFTSRFSHPALRLPVVFIAMSSASVFASEAADPASPFSLQGELDPAVAQHVEQIEVGFPARRDTVLNINLGLGVTSREPPSASTAPDALPQAPAIESIRELNYYGAWSSMMLRQGIHLQKANEVIRRIAEWFEHPHPAGRELQGEVDFAALELARLYIALEDSPSLEEATREKIRTFFLRHDIKSRHPSENHVFVFATALHLMAGKLPASSFSAYGDKTGEQLRRESADWLKTFIRYRARQGWGEFDSDSYQGLVFNTLLSLHDHSTDPELVLLARKMANLLLADWMVDTLNGLYGGARGRIPESMAMNHNGGLLSDLQYLYFGIGGDPTDVSAPLLIKTQRLSRLELSHQALYSSFRPEPIVTAIALHRTFPYENRERKHLHNLHDTLPSVPLDASIRKVTYLTDNYVLGAIQRQDPYPEGGVRSYAKHQQHEWDFTVSHGRATRARIFTHHPGASDRHTYWRGSNSGSFVDTFQHGSAVLAIWDIPPAQKYQFIHAYLPKAAFDEVIEADGWIFARKGEALAALFLHGGYEWTSTGNEAGREVVSQGAKKASVFEAGRLADFGSFENFRQQIAANTIEFDPDTMTLSYHSSRNGHIRIGPSGLREVDGAPADLDYPTYASPYLISAWDSGVARLSHGDASLVLDFTAPENSSPSMHDAGLAGDRP